MRAILILLAVAATPAAADDYCHDLWFTRNAIMDRAWLGAGPTGVRQR